MRFRVERRGEGTGRTGHQRATAGAACEMDANHRAEATHITLRIMTSRWGSCTPKTGRIRLNLQLGLMDPRFLEYVLVHEMTHLWENGHGEDFQRRMSAYLPQWRQLRRELNRHVVL